jgi:hypothetical protein
MATDMLLFWCRPVTAGRASFNVNFCMAAYKCMHVLQREKIKTNPPQADDFSYSHQMNRNHAMSIQSAPSTLSRDPSFQNLDASQRSFSTSDQGSWTLEVSTPLDAHHSRTSRKRSRRAPLPEVIEAKTYEVGEYVLANTTNHNLNYSPLDMSYHDPNRLSVSSHYTWGSQTESSAVSSPMTPSLASPSTLSSTNMSRTGSVQSNFSALPSTFAPSFEMMRMGSDISHISSSASPSDQHFGFQASQPPSNTQKSAPSRSSRHLHYRSRTKPSSVNVSSSDVPVSTSSSQSRSYQLATSMKRSDSSQSTSSASSSQDSSRSARRRYDTLLQQKNTPILPKSSSSTKVDAHKMARVKSDDGSWKQVGVLPREKQTYQRPQHPKLYCSYCKDHPEGFRGEHELQRHTNRAHSDRRKVWICVDSSPDGFLANCKACRTQKRYGAYYNAAAQ